jgi:hypothetical protein
MDYANVPPKIGMVVSRAPELMGPLTSSLGLEDLYDLIEVLMVDIHNDRVMDRIAKENAR